MQNTTTIPFSGFYESWHSGDIDQEIISYFDIEGRGDSSLVPDDIYMSFPYGDAYKRYAEEYAESFNNWFTSETGLSLDLKFESLVSPREYNFTTDRIFCFITPEKKRELFNHVDKDKLRKVIKEHFTSRSGFSSFYSNDLDQWLLKPVEDWDHNQIGTLINAAMPEEFNDYDVMEDDRGNGVISNIVSDLMPQSEGVEK